MDILTSIILGTIQGLTEFLPISSSGHLVIAQHALEGTTDAVFVLLVHFATLVAVVLYFIDDIKDIVRALLGSGNGSRNDMAYPLIIATIPAAVMGVLFESYVEQAFDSEIAVACALIITGAMLVLASKLSRGEKTINMVGRKGAATIGLFQAMALFPGISRSGSTIVGGLYNKLVPSEAARFSFLLSIPTIGGATVFKLSDIAAYDAANTLPYAIGMVMAFVSGLAGIRILMRAVTHGRLHIFGYYCIALAAVVIVVSV